MNNRTLEKSQGHKLMVRERIEASVVEIPKREARPGSAGLKTQLPGICTTVSALAFYGNSLIER